MRKTLLWLIGIIPAVLFSQSKDTLHDLQVLDPASVSCSIKGVAVSGATEQVKVIGAQTIKEMGAQNAAEVLQNQSGILISQDAQLGTGISLQGLSGQSVKILVNGAPVAGPAPDHAEPAGDLSGRGLLSPASGLHRPVADRWAQSHNL